MRFPSLKTLEQITTPEKAIELRELAQKKRKIRDYKVVSEWCKSCYHQPSYIERFLCAADEILETFGVEYIEVEGSSRAVYAYCNTGDAYAPTLIYSYETGAFSVRSWGDIVERRGY